MKKLTALLMAVLLVLAVSGCKSQNKEKQEAVVPAEPTPVPAEYLGSYHEEIAGRGMLELKENEVIIDWSDSAFEKEHFEFSVSYKAEDNTMSYSGGKRIRITFESEEKSSEEEIYADGSGYFVIGDKKLIWHDDKAESGAEPTVFVKDEAMIGIPNPWTYTENLDEAIKASGLEFFDPPVSVPEGYEFVTYGAMDGIIEAQYESDENKMVIRKSETLEGTDLSGDYNSYPENWEKSLKGLSVNLFGDGEKITAAYFGLGPHFSLNIYDKNGGSSLGKGITIDELSSIVMGMQ